MFTVQILQGQALINVVVNFNTEDVSANGNNDFLSQCLGGRGGRFLPNAFRPLQGMCVVHFISPTFIFQIFLRETLFTIPCHFHSTIPIAPGDYTSTIELLTFTPGRTSLTVSVPTMDDSIFETDEIFEGILSLPVGGSDRISLRDERAAAVIEDNDSKIDHYYFCVYVTFYFNLIRCQGWFQSNSLLS